MTTSTADKDLWAVALGKLKVEDRREIEEPQLVENKIQSLDDVSLLLCHLWRGYFTD